MSLDNSVLAKQYGRTPLHYSKSKAIVELFNASPSVMATDYVSCPTSGGVLHQIAVPLTLLTRVLL